MDVLADDVNHVVEHPGFLDASGSFEDDRLGSAGEFVETRYAPELMGRTRIPQQVADALDDLPKEQADILRLSFFEGKSHGEIAEHIGLPLGTVKSRIRLAFDRLRNSLTELEL